MPIELKNVTRVYKSNVEVRALDDVSLSVAPGEWLAVMGPSGSGKSTLVNLMGCLDQPTSGEIWIHGTNISKMSPAELNRFRAEKSRLHLPAISSHPISHRRWKTSCWRNTSTA